MNTQKAVPGQHFLNLPQLKFGKNGFVPGSNANIFFQAFNKQDLIYIYLNPFLAHIKEQGGSFRNCC